MSDNIPSIYDVATEGSNLSKGKGEDRSVYAVLCVVVGCSIILLNLLELSRSRK